MPGRCRRALAAWAFEDDDGTVHEPALDALADRGVLAGTECGDDRVCPGAEIERWVMAVWLVRALGESPSAASTRFADVDPDAWWAPYVERLAGIRVTQGCATGPARYCPDAPVTRGQMATFLARALKLVPLAEAAAPARLATRYTAVGAGEFHVCALNHYGTVTCWGSNHHGQLDAPGGRFSGVAVGFYHSCGLRTDRTVACWGSDERGQLDTPAGSFTALTGGGCQLPTGSVAGCPGGDGGRLRIVSMRASRRPCSTRVVFIDLMSERTHMRSTLSRAPTKPIMVGIIPSITNTI